jgi:hypothetical protein
VDEQCYTTQEKASKYECLLPLLQAMHNDFTELSKKKPEGALNKRKVQIVNRLLNDVFTILDGEPTRQFLDLLDEDDLPQNSDVALVLGQAQAAMRGFREKYWDKEEDEWLIAPSRSNKRAR